MASGEVTAVNAQIRPEPLDELTEMYVEWREECSGLTSAYRRWLNAQAADRDLAFAAYRAALDREEQASVTYAKRVALVWGPAMNANRAA
jgi:hypothetical protein